MAAGREVLRLTKQYVKRRQSFAVETTLSGKSYLLLMRYAREISRGFEVVLIYIGTESVEINLVRISERVRVGGHSVPENDVRRRYLRSFENLPIAAKHAHHVLLFDNSTVEGYRLVVIFLLPTTNGFLRYHRGSLNSKRLFLSGAFRAQPRTFTFAFLHLEI